jgi:Fe-Mn family superoxide dismutase
MTYALPPLRFAYHDLEPHLSAATVARHHDGIHRGYVEAINALLAERPECGRGVIEDVMRALADMPADLRERVRFEGGGHADHQFLWKILGPTGNDGPRGALAAEIERHFGSFAAFRDRFTAAALALPTPGWAFLALDRPVSGGLAIVTLPWNDSVLPIAKPGVLICDLWDHAWEGDLPDRAAWLETFWKIVDWRVCEYRLDGLRKGVRNL